MHDYWLINSGGVTFRCIKCVLLKISSKTQGTTANNMCSDSTSGKTKNRFLWPYPYYPSYDSPTTLATTLLLPYPYLCL